METQKARYFFVDGIRGAAVISMTAFHFLYDVFIIYEKNPSWYDLPAIHIWQQMICRTFIFLSGFVWQLGMEHGLRRGFRFNLYGFCISAVTLALIPSQAVWFGILNFMGCAVWLMYPLQRGLRKVPPVLGFVSCLLLFVLSRQVPHGRFGIGGGMQVPAVFYSMKILTPLGFPFPGFWSSDYFPLVPWIFLYLSGYFFYEIFRTQDAWQAIARYRIPVLSAAGRRTIWIYLLHQPACMLVCSLIF